MTRGLMAASLCAVTSCLTPVPGMAADRPAPVDAIYHHGETPLNGLGGPMDLVSHTGKPFALRDVQGGPTLLFFGFTQCGQTCPTAMAQAQQLLASFKTRRPPSVLFVTLDPLSDDPKALVQYLSHFDNRIIGLTGSPHQIEQVAQRYGVALNRSAGPLEHSSRWYLLDERGQLARVYKIDTPVSAMAQDIVRAQSHRAASPWQ